MAEPEARELLNGVVRQLAELARAVNLAHWAASTTGSPESQEQASQAETRLRMFLSSRSRYQRIVELLASGELRDPLIRRQLELLALEHRPNQLSGDVIDDLVRRSNEIQSEFYTFRAQFDGREFTNNEILEVMRGERNEARRKAVWEASKQIAPRVAPRLLALVRRRNEAARSLGYRDFYAMYLELQEIDEAELMRVFGELEQSTDGPFRDAKASIDARLAARYAIRPDNLRPWHYEDPFFQEPPLSEELGLAAYFKGRDLPAIAERFFGGIGLPVDDVLERSDLYERPGKDQHAYCFHIDRGGDVRLLCNLKEDDRWMGTLLHELGHAAYEKFMPKALPWILRQPTHIAMTEAIAMFMDRLLYDVDWLEGAAGIDPDDRSALRERAWSSHRFESLLTARWVMVMTHFERTLYADPERADLDSLWWDLVERLQLVPRPEGREAPDWAAKIHLTVAPVYYHNYLLGELIASQIGATFRDALAPDTPVHGFVECQELGAFLRERIFEHGAGRHWQTVLESATGSRLAPDAFVDEFVRRRTAQKPCQA